MEGKRDDPELQGIFHEPAKEQAFSLTVGSRILNYLAEIVH